MDRLLRQGGQFQQMPGHIEDVHPDVFWWRTIPQDLETILKEMKTDHSALSEVKFLLLSWLGAQNRIKLYYRKIALCAVLAWRPRLRYVHSLSENAGTKEDRGTKSADLLESHWVLPGAAGELPVSTLSSRSTDAIPRCLSVGTDSQTLADTTRVKGRTFPSTAAIQFDSLGS